MMIAKDKENYDTLWSSISKVLEAEIRALKCFTDRIESEIISEGRQARQLCILKIGDFQKQGRVGGQNVRGFLQYERRTSLRQIVSDVNMLYAQVLFHISSTV